MKRTSIVIAIFTLVCVTAFAVQPPGLPTLTIHPLAVALPPGSNQYFVASFSDGSAVQSCLWTAPGANTNGVKITSTNKEWAVFFTGTLRGVNYTLTATCTNDNRVYRTASALVLVR
jgi:hypothetical protein